MATMKRVAMVLVWAALVATAEARGQSLATEKELPDAISRFEQRKNSKKLNCEQVEMSELAVLGLDLRYHGYFNVRIPAAELAEGGMVLALLRVTPQNGKAVILGEEFEVPSVSDLVKSLKEIPGPLLHRMQGGFVVGPGKYKVELLLTAPNKRTRYKRVRLKTEATRYTGVMKRNAVGADPQVAWDGKLQADGLRLTILVNATAPSGAEAKLWEYPLLTGMTQTVLEQVACRSVRVVAFNLDQQVEMYGSDNFAPTKWKAFNDSLTGAELSTIDYRKLSSGSAAEYLQDLVEKETEARPDAVVILGLRMHFMEWPKRTINKEAAEGGVKLVYLRNDMLDFLVPEFETKGKKERKADSVTHLVRGMQGTVVMFQTASEFGKAMEKLKTDLGEGTKSAAPKQGPAK